jgi:hypothetical protein
MKCKDCEYEPRCFDALRVLNKLKTGFCKQGRMKREYRIKPVTLKDILDVPIHSGSITSPPSAPGGGSSERSGTDITMEKVLPMQ